MIHTTWTDSGSLRTIFILSSALWMVAPAPAANPTEVDEGRLVRFEFDNDIIGDTDDFFSAGWSLQSHSRAATSWDDLSIGTFSRWITDTIPGISGGDGQFVRRGDGISQIIQTPADLAETELIEDDVPYAGVLDYAASWTSLSDERINVFQITVGVLGPASLAEEVQTFVHVDMGLGDEPMGWDNQLRYEPILNLNYALAHKLGRLGDPRSFGADLAVGGGAGLGNLMTIAQVGFESRLGWAIPYGFTHIPDVAGRGVIVDPVLLEKGTNDLRFYLSLAMRAAAMGYTVLLDGNTFEDSHSVPYDPYQLQAVVGVHLEKNPWEFRFNTFISSNPAKDSVESELNWSNFSLGYRF